MHPKAVKADDRRGRAPRPAGPGFAGLRRTAAVCAALWLATSAPAAANPAPARRAKALDLGTAGVTSVSVQSRAVTQRPAVSGRAADSAPERLVNGVPMPRLCAMLAAWADRQGLSATEGPPDMTGLMTARFDIGSRWWIETGVGAGNNLRGGADIFDPRRLGVATLNRLGYRFERSDHARIEMRANLSTVTLSSRQLALTLDLTLRVY